MQIVFVGEGRLGNQIFQYTALCALASPGSRMLAFGLEDLESLFELRGPRLTCLRGGIWFKRFAKYCIAGLLLRPLARWLRLISYAHEPDSGDTYRGKSGRLELRRGLLRDIVFVDGGYFQSSEHWGELFPPRWLTLRAEWRNRAREVLARLGQAPLRPYFLHLRRGDFAGFETHGVKDLLLPTTYFRDALAEFRAAKTFDLLILVTDDAEWAKREFADFPESVVVSGDPRTDFALMAGCAGGIVSNSTFSLAAALFMPEPELLIAPRYWFGFRVREWLPPGIRFDHPRIVYRDVLPAAA